MISINRSYKEITADMDYEPREEELVHYLPIEIIQTIKDYESELIFYGYSWGDIWGYMLPKERMKAVNIWFNRYGLANILAGPSGVRILNVSKECVKLTNSLCFRRNKIWNK